MDCSPPGSSLHGILQARILEWVAMPSSSGSSLTQALNPRLLCLLHWQVDSLRLSHQGHLHIYIHMFIHIHLYACLNIHLFYVSICSSLIHFKGELHHYRANFHDCDYRVNFHDCEFRSFGIPGSPVKTGEGVADLSSMWPDYVLCPQLSCKNSKAHGKGRLLWEATRALFW